MNQWYDELTLCFAAEVGLLGGGYYDIQPLTVTTYDSAYMNMDRLGEQVRPDRLRRVPPPARPDLRPGRHLRHRPVPARA